MSINTRKAMEKYTISKKKIDELIAEWTEEYINDGK